MCINCTNCKNAVWDGGYGDGWNEPHVPEYVYECKVPEVVEKFEGEYEKEGFEEKLPNLCGHYDPIMIEKCDICKKTINIPQWLFDQNRERFTTQGYWDEIVVCSDECKIKAKEIVKKEREEIDASVK